jgi:NADH-quinone oxidoreductase subunit H
MLLAHVDIPTVFFYLPVLLLFTLGVIYAERKIAAFIQDRLGPMEVGYRGLLQTLADMLKLIQKEIIIPTAADKKLFLLAPIWVLTMVVTAFAVLPVTSRWGGAATQGGLLYALAIPSLKMLGIFIAGWASNNKYARLGALRAIAQLFAYEVPLLLSILCVVIVSHSLDLQIISLQQGNSWPQGIDLAQHSYFLGIPGFKITHWGGIFSWNIFRMPSLFFAYIIFFIASLAASSRTPFDLTEAESELVGGYHTEYGGLLWAWFMLAEYSMMLLLSLLGVILFWGSWHTPFPNWGMLRLADWTSGCSNVWLSNIWGFFWLLAKALIISFFKIWVKWSLPRLHVEQMLYFCWVYLVPMGLVTLLITLWWQVLIL